MYVCMYTYIKMEDANHIWLCFITYIVSLSNAWKTLLNREQGNI